MLWQLKLHFPSFFSSQLFIYVCTPWNNSLTEGPIHYHPSTKVLKETDSFCQFRLGHKTSFGLAGLDADFYSSLDILIIPAGGGYFTRMN